MQCFGQIELNNQLIVFYFFILTLLIPQAESDESFKENRFISEKNIQIVFLTSLIHLVL